MKILKAVSLAERIEAAFYSRDKSDDWVTWAMEHPADNALLVSVERLVNHA